MVAHDIATICTRAGYTVWKQAAGIVLAQRPIPGLGEGSRCAIFLLGGDHWRGSLYVSRPGAEARLVSERNTLTHADDLELWLGGASSVPASGEEAAAIIASPVAEPQICSWCKEPAYFVQDENDQWRSECCAALAIPVEQGLDIEGPSPAERFFLEDR